jgi:glycosyltransferase involved in cell wall biosynthesis
MVHLFPPRHCAGAEMMLESMLRPLVERGHQVDVLLSREVEGLTEPYQRYGITIHPHVGRDDPWDFVAQSDVVITHLENTARASVLCAKMRRPVVQVLHNNHPTTKAFLAPSTGLAVFNSQWMADDFGYSGHSVIVRPPIFAEDYRTTPGDSVTLINLSPTKGAFVFYGLAERMPDVPFLGVTGAYGEQIIRTDLPNVTILPHGGDMRAAYGRTKVLLTPSDYESWGRVGVEAMVCGIPVLSHPTEGLLESLGDAGTFRDRADLDAWEQALRELLTPKHWRAMSAKAKARALELDPTDDLNRWCEAIEAFGTRARAFGGPVTVSGERLVGERGPEVFHPLAS